MKRIILTAGLIFGLSMIFLLKTDREIKNDNDVSRLYSGTLIDMVSPDIAPTYSLNGKYAKK